MKRISAFFLCALIFVSTVSTVAFAASDEEILAEVVQDEPVAEQMIPEDGSMENCDETETVQDEPVAEQTIPEDGSDGNYDETDVYLEDELIDSGGCGENVLWELTEDYVLFIILNDWQQTGAMTDYSTPEEVPWHTYSSNIVAADIMSGVTHIGALAFSGCTGLHNVYFGADGVAWNAITIGAGNEALTKATMHSKEHIAGDVNFDGKVNIIDLLTLCRLCNGDFSIKYDENATNINNDDAKADANDVMWLLRYLAGEQVTVY